MPSRSLGLSLRLLLLGGGRPGLCPCAHTCHLFTDTYTLRTDPHKPSKGGLLPLPTSRRCSGACPFASGQRPPECLSSCAADRCWLVPPLPASVSWAWRPHSSPGGRGWRTAGQGWGPSLWRGDGGARRAGTLDFRSENSEGMHFPLSGPQRCPLLRQPWHTSEGPFLGASLTAPSPSRPPVDSA